MECWTPFGEVGDKRHFPVVHTSTDLVKLFVFDGLMTEVISWVLSLNHFVMVSFDEHTDLCIDRDSQGEGINILSLFLWVECFLKLLVCSLSTYGWYNGPWLLCVCMRSEKRRETRSQEKRNLERGFQLSDIHRQEYFVHSNVLRFLWWTLWSYPWPENKKELQESWTSSDCRSKVTLHR